MYAVQKHKFVTADTGSNIAKHVCAIDSNALDVDCQKDICRKQKKGRKSPCIRETERYSWFSAFP